MTSHPWEGGVRKGMILTQSPSPLPPVGVDEAMRVKVPSTRPPSLSLLWGRVRVGAPPTQSSTLSRQWRGVWVRAPPIQSPFPFPPVGRSASGSTSHPNLPSLASRKVGEFNFKACA